MEKNYGGSGDERSTNVLETADGNYLVVGYTTSIGAGDVDAYLIKIDGLGYVIWDVTMGGTNYDRASWAAPMNDGHYLIVGESQAMPNGDYNIVTYKVNEAGQCIITRTYDSPGNQLGFSIVPTQDHGFAVVGRTSAGAGGADVALLKLSSQGRLSSGLAAGANNATLIIQYGPNPVVDDLNITTSHAIQYEVLDLTRKIVESGSLNANVSSSISTVQWCVGAYVLFVISATGAQTHKLIKK